MLKSKIAPSMMCADVVEMGKILDLFAKNSVELLHIDIMDGHFVPNLALSADYCKMLKRHTDIPLDVHLMVTDPIKCVDWFELGASDYISVHAESNGAKEALERIKAKGVKAMLAISPDTSENEVKEYLPLLDGVLVMTVYPGFAGQKLVEKTLDKIKALRKYLDESGYGNIEIEVDGNVSFENAVRMKNSGANIFVAGSSSVFYKGADMQDNIQKMRECIN